MLTLFGVVSVIFLLFNLLPGDPARMMLDQNENAAQLENIRQKYGFDKPKHIQYLYYINDISPISWHNAAPEAYTSLNSEKYSIAFSVSLGQGALALKWPYLRESFQKKGKSVSAIILDTLPNTFVLATASILIAFVLGVCLGIVSVLYQNTFWDRLIQLVSTLGMSLPSFFSAILAAWLFGFVWHEFTGLPMTGSLYNVDDFGEGKYLQLQNLILPANVLQN